MQHLNANEEGELDQSHQQNASVQPLLLRLIAHLLSFVFHPLFIPGYIAGFLIFVHPYAFSGFDSRLKMLRFISVVLLTAFFPAFVEIVNSFKQNLVPTG